MYESRIAEDILAEHLVHYGAVSFLTDAPMRLKSGLVTPIYVDNRSLTCYPDAWRDIIETTVSRLDQMKLEYDVIAGVEGAGVSHAAALAYRLYKPSIFVAPAAEDLRQPQPRRRRRRQGQARSSDRRPHLDGASRSSPRSKASRLKAPSSPTALRSPRLASTKRRSSSSANT